MTNEPDITYVAQRFRVVRKRRQLPDGAWHEREVIEHPGAAVILPILADERICLIRNYRVAVGQELIELPAGTLDPGEDPLETARRELIEETGYRAASLEKIHDFVVSPGIMNERMHLYLATGLTPGDTAREQGEQIQNLLVPWAEALAMVDRQEIRDAKTIVGLLWYDRARRRG